MNCKDCLHYEACKEKFAGLYEIMVEEPKKHLELNPNVEKRCLHFTDHSEWVHLPFSINDTLYYPYKDDNQAKVVPLEIEFLHIFPDTSPIIYVKPHTDIPIPSYYYYEAIGKIIFRTKKEAFVKLYSSILEEPKKH